MKALLETDAMFAVMLLPASTQAAGCPRLPSTRPSCRDALVEEQTVSRRRRKTLATRPFSRESSQHLGSRSVHHPIEHVVFGTGAPALIDLLRPTAAHVPCAAATYFARVMPCRSATARPAQQSPLPGHPTRSNTASASSG
jgi:hypothetical protein